MSRLRVYVAGPYSADNVLDVLGNIREGIKVCKDLFSRGFAPFCPWLDYHYELIREHCKDSYYEASVAWLGVSEAVLVIGSGDSYGVELELRRAADLCIPVFHDVTSLIIWRNRRDDG